MSSDLQGIINGLVPHFESHGIQFMIIGAKARDIISEQSGLPLSARKTSDVDFGILIDNWNTLEALRKSFEADKSIKESSSKDNKIRYYFNETPFDLLPFGGVEKDGKVSWPPFYDTIMTVIGHQEALDYASDIEIGTRRIKVVTPEMLVALKIVSWEENPARQRDADDINYIISNYERIDPDTDDYIWDNHEDLPEKFDHDMSLAAIALLGIRIKNYASNEHTELIIKVLSNTEIREKLVRAMLASRLGPSDDGELKLASAKLQALSSGVQH